MQTRHATGATPAPTRKREPQGRPADLPAGFRLTSVSEGPLLEAGEHFVYDIYRQVGYCEESELRRVEELQEWAQSSILHVVHNANDEVIGTCRNILGPYGSLPIGQLERRDHSDGDPVVEMSAVAIEASVRSAGVIEHLLRSSWLYALRHDCQALVAVVEPWFLEVFQLTYRLPWREIGIGRDYMGGFSVPIGLTLSGSSFERLSRELPAFWRWALEPCTPAEVARWELPIVLTDSSDDTVDKVFEAHDQQDVVSGGERVSPDQTSI